MWEIDGYDLVSFNHLATPQWQKHTMIFSYSIKRISYSSSSHQYPAIIVYFLYYSGSETAEPVTGDENLQKTKNNFTHGDSYMDLRDGCLMDCATAVPDHKPWPSGK